MKIKSMASKHKVGKKKKTQSGGQVSEKKKLWIVENVFELK